MKKAVWLSILVIALGGAGILYFWLERQTPHQQALKSPPVSSPEPAKHYPIESAGQAEESELSQPLPALADSDGAMRDALMELFGQKLDDFFNLHDIIHRVVASVDNLALESAPQQVMPVKPVKGWLITTGEGQSLSLSAKNAARYRPYVRLAESVPTAPLVAAYVRFYPLFQEQYEKLGYPEKYFNDRLVQVIDHLLAAPEVTEPILLTQSRVLYQFADPRLEALTAGQKIMVRMGRENAASVKTKLREIRSALVTKPPKADGK